MNTSRIPYLIILFVLSFSFMVFHFVSYGEEVAVTSISFLLSSFIIVGIWIYSIVLASRIRDINSIWFVFLFTMSTIATPLLLWRIYKGRYIVS